jgi:hypothetical protein
MYVCLCPLTLATSVVPPAKKQKNCSPKSSGNRLADGRFTDAWWTDETDLALHRPAKFPHAKELKDAVLDILQSINELFQVWDTFLVSAGPLGI